MLPIDFNSILNISVAASDSNYLLIKAHTAPDYTICQVRSWLTPFCSTHYTVSGTNGGNLSTVCEDAGDPLAYHRSVQDAPAYVLEPDYRDVAALAFISLTLNTGITNANASSNRLLSEFALNYPAWETKFTLSNVRPSLAETLAVISGSMS